MTFQPPHIDTPGRTSPFDWGWSLAFGDVVEPCGGWPGGLAGSPSTLEDTGWSIYKVVQPIYGINWRAGKSQVL